MSFLDYGSRLQGSLGRYGRDIDTFKDSVINDKFADIQKMFDPEISSTATTLTNLANTKTNVENIVGGTSGSLEAIGSAVGVKKLYGAIKEKLGGKSLGDKKQNNEIEEENTGESNTENSMTDMERAFGTEAEQNEVPDWLKPAFKNTGDEEGGSNMLENLFGKAKSGLSDLKSSVGNKMSEIQGNIENKISDVQENIQNKVSDIQDNIQNKVSDVVGGEDAPSKLGGEVEMTDMTRTDEERAFGTEAEQNEPADWLDGVDASIQKGTGSTLAEDETETLGKTLLTKGLGRPTQAGSGNLLKPTGATNEAPTQVNDTASNVSGDVNDVVSGVKDTEDALDAVETVADTTEAVEATTSVLGGFLDAIPVVGAIAGIALQVGGAIFGAVEEGKEQSLEKQESAEQSQEKSAEQTAQESVKSFGNTNFTGSTVVPTFSALGNMKNMGGGSGVF